MHIHSPRSERTFIHSPEISCIHALNKTTTPDHLVSTHNNNFPLSEVKQQHSQEIVRINFPAQQTIVFLSFSEKKNFYTHLISVTHDDDGMTG